MNQVSAQFTRDKFASVLVRSGRVIPDESYINTGFVNAGEKRRINIGTAGKETSAHNLFPSFFDTPGILKMETQINHR